MTLDCDPFQVNLEFLSHTKQKTPQEGSVSKKLGAYSLQQSSPLTQNRKLHRKAGSVKKKNWGHTIYNKAAPNQSGPSRLPRCHQPGSATLPDKLSLFNSPTGTFWVAVGKWEQLDRERINKINGGVRRHRICSLSRTRAPAAMGSAVREAAASITHEKQLGGKSIATASTGIFRSGLQLHFSGCNSNDQEKEGEGKI